MDTRHIARTATVIVVAALLMAFAFAVAPLALKPAYAADATKTATVTAAPAQGGGTEAAPAEGASAKTGEKKEIPHVVGHPNPAQLQDLRRAWSSIPGFDLLLVSIIGLIVTVGVVGFGVYKQMRI
jgi:hypothetical protein